MIALRNVATLGLLLVVAGSCSNDFDQFDFKGEEGNGSGGSTTHPGYTGGSVGTIPRNAGGNTSGSGKGGSSTVGQGDKGNGSAGKAVGTAGATNLNGGRPGDGPPGGGKPGDGGPPGGAGRSIGAGGTGAGGTGAGGASPGGMGKAGSSQGGANGTAGGTTCPKDQADCGAGCVPLTTPQHCGSCANVCSVGLACVNGACACRSDDCAGPGANGEGGQGGQGGQGGAAGASSSSAF